MGMCNKSKIISNSIINNKIGIYFENADPLIQSNSILSSKMNAISCHAKDMVKCDGEIKFNDIKETKEVGIVCSGSLN
jgi:parallel beta-helix repeat protein